MSDSNRRQFLKSTSAGLAGSVAVASAPAARAANAVNEVVVGLVGHGGRGRHVASLFAAQENVRIGWVADANKNRYIEPGEFPQLMLTGASFEMVDADNDGKVMRDELTEFIKDQTAVQQSRLLLNVTHKSRSLFDLLDANSDRRLSEREFREGYSRLRTVDSDRDGRISRTDLSGDYVLTLEVARAALFTNDAMAMPAPQVPRTASTLDKRAGPSWFQRMDRNGDGDVSGREFLGGLALFTRMDRNRDGLISLQEAKVLEPNK